MTRSRGLCLFHICTGLGILLQTAVLSAAGTDAEEADHEALRDLKRIFEEAVNQNQLDLLKPHLSEDFSAVTYTNREFTDFEAFKVQWQKTRETLLRGGTYRVKLLPERSQLMGEFAIAKGNSENVLVTGGGNEYHFASYWTALCRKENDNWRILRAHSTLDPFGNPMLKAAVRRSTIKFVIGSLLVGFMIGWLVKMLYARSLSRHANQ